MSMITSTSWVPRGYASEFPTRHEFDQDEYDRISRLAKLNLDDAKADLDEARTDDKAASRPVKNAAAGPAKADDDSDALKEYDLEHYDDEPDNDHGDADDEDSGATSIFGNIKALAYHESNDEDPYITLKGGETADSDDEDREDLQILPTDSLLLAGRVEDEVAHLEVYVYEDEAENLYVHHDIMLPAIPLCVEWLDFAVGKQDADPSSRANFVAVGTMDPDIELWDLDTMDSMFPNAILGAGASNPDGTPKRRKKKKAPRPRDDYHVDAVLSLAANRQHRNLLASASADKTVKLWDLNTQKCARSYAYHTDKVCSLAWHPSEPTAVLSGSYDASAVAADMRAPDGGTRRYAVDSPVESVAWNPHDDRHFYVSTEGGMLFYFDARAADAPVWRLHAHEKALTAFAPCPHLPGLLATGSDDKAVKLWDTSAVGPKAGPALVASRDLDVGRVFSLGWAPDAEVALRLAVAGSSGNLRVWDASSSKAVRGRFGGRVPRTAAGGGADDRVIGVGDGEVSDESDSDDDDDDDDDDEDGEDDWEEAGEDEEMEDGSGD